MLGRPAIFLEHFGRGFGNDGQFGSPRRFVGLPREFVTFLADDGVCVAPRVGKRETGDETFRRQVVRVLHHLFESQRLRVGISGEKELRRSHSLMSRKCHLLSGEGFTGYSYVPAVTSILFSIQ